MVSSSPQSQIGKSLIWNLKKCCCKPTCPNLNRVIAVSVLPFLQQAQGQCPMVLFTLFKALLLFVSSIFLSHTLCHCFIIYFFNSLVLSFTGGHVHIFLFKCRSSLAALSAWILPGIPLCAGTHCSFTQHIDSKSFNCC